MLFNINIVKLLLKKRWGKKQKASFLIFVVWSALIADGWVVACDRKPYLGPAEISCFVYLVQLKDEGCRVSLRLHLFVFDVDSGNKDFV